MSYLILGLIIFIAFSVGLNLGLHGVINVHNSAPASTQRGSKAAEAVERGILDGDVKVNGVTGDSNIIPSSASKIKLESKLSVAIKEVKRDRGSASRIVSKKISQVVKPSTPESSMKRSQKHENIIETTTTIAPRTESARYLVDKAIETKTYADLVKRASSSLEDESAHISSRDDISRYIDKGGKLPVVMMTCNRATLLKTTLASLFSVRGMSKSNVIVLQDGKDREVETIVRDHGLHLIQHDAPNLRHADGATRIAKHYKYSLTAAFEHFSDAPAIIIAEDDLLFSPDFLDYFEHVAPILDVDETSFLVSAWNDNGYVGKVDDPYALRRTEFFPGLGWLLPRKLYKHELEEKWPSEHWDHWLRSPGINKGREIIFPQVPRTYHNGIRGTFMDMGTHNRYFRDIAYNQNRELSWQNHAPVSISGAALSHTSEVARGAVPLPIYAQAVKDVYEERIRSLISRCTHLQAAPDLLHTNGIVCIWIDVSPDGMPGRPPPFEPAAKFFGIWHEHSRGVHKGLHEFYFGSGNSKYILLLNVFERDGPGKARTYGALKPSHATIINPRDFTLNLRANMDLEKQTEQLKASGVKIVGARETGRSCDEICAAEPGTMSCFGPALAWMNSCSALKSVFACTGGCSSSMGSEQPAMVSETADSGQGHKPGLCVFSTNAAASTCGASHKYTQRACPCKPREG